MSEKEGYMVWMSISTAIFQGFGFWYDSADFRFTYGKQPKSPCFFE